MVYENCKTQLVCTLVYCSAFSVFLLKGQPAAAIPISVSPIYFFLPDTFLAEDTFYLLLLLPTISKNTIFYNY
jgi:hypothetical protein